jgi:predicted metal-binding membrane protein
MHAVDRTDHASLSEPGTTSARFLAQWPWALVLAAWILALLATWTHQSYLINHDYLIQESGLPWIAALLFFLICWQVMIGTMMLPSSLPLVSRRLRAFRPLHTSMVVFLAGYALMWTAFAAVAFLGDTGIHWLVNHWSWLALHLWVIGTVSFALAGLFQFSPLKQRALRACQNARQCPTCAAGPEVRDAWRLGWHHGCCCLGSCWALMLLMFGVGVGSVIWMAVLTGVMMAEKVIPGARWLSPVIGVAALVLAGVWITHPADLLLGITS